MFQGTVRLEIKNTIQAFRMLFPGILGVRANRFPVFFLFLE